MARETTAAKNGIVESFSSMGRQCLSSLRGCALVAGGMGGVVIVGLLLLVLVFPLFVFVSVLLKIVGL